MINRLTGYPSIDKPWLKYYSDQANNVKIPDVNIYEYMKLHNKENVKQVAINYFGNKITFQQLIDKIECVSRSFLEYGVKSGDIVTLSMANIPENVICLYALNNIGAIANLIDLRMKGKELMDAINLVDSKMIIATDLFAKNLLDIAEYTRLTNIVISSPGNSLPPIVKQLYCVRNKSVVSSDISFLKIDSWKSFEKKGIYSDMIPNYCSCSDDGICILHTSGTTGTPKGVVLTNKNFNAMVVQYKYCGLAFNQGETFMSQVPPFLAYSALMAIHLPLSLGLTLKMLPDYQPDKFAKHIIKFKPEHVIAGPADWNSFLNLDKKQLKKIKTLDFMSTMASGSDRIDPANKNKLNKIFEEKGSRSKIIEGYGMTEVSSAAVTNLPQINIDGSVGIPLPLVNVCIYDSKNNKELKFNEIGEICFYGPTVMKEYFNNIEETERILQLHDDGMYWLHSGDVGYMSDDGLLYFKERIKRVIVRHDGIKVSPFDIENVLNQIMEVKTSCVVGISDVEHGQGEIPVANIVLKDGFKQIDIDIIRESCEKELGKKYVPAYYVIRDELPLTDVGKVDYRKLEKQNKKEFL